MKTGLSFIRIRNLVYIKALLLIGCANIPNLCDGFTSVVEPARAAYFATNRIYPLPADIYALAAKYKPRLVIHPDGQKPIDFADYLANANLLGPAKKTNRPIADIAQLSYDEQCHSYIEPSRDPVISQPPYPWYLQAFRDQAPGDPSRQWTYLKFNLVFDWSGLGVDLGGLAQVGVTLLGGSAARWHRLDIHTAVVIAIDERGYQRAIAINQHNYVRTYLGGKDFVMTEPATVVAAFRTNELYLDSQKDTAEQFPVVRFYDDLLYLIAGEGKPFLLAQDLVVGAQAGGIELPTRLTVIEPQAPLAAFAGLLAPPKRLLGMIYTGRDGPMGYDYYSLPATVPLNRLTALGYWQEGDLALADQLRPLLEGIEFFGDEEEWQPLVQFMEKRIHLALEEQEQLLVK